MKRIAFLVVAMGALVPPKSTFGQGSAEAWYDPSDGRFIVSVRDVDSWFITTVPRDSPYFKGPPFDPVSTGVLPASPARNTVASASRDTVAEAGVARFTYGPLDLGPIAEPNRRLSDFDMFYFDGHPGDGRVHLIPEPPAICSTVYLLVGVAVGTYRRRRHRQWI